jgi:hypothetical protein
MRKRQVFRPALDTLEDRLVLNAGMANFAQLGAHQGQFGGQSTSGSAGADGESKDGVADVERNDGRGDVESNDGLASGGQTGTTTSSVPQQLAATAQTGTGSATHRPTATISLSGVAQGTYTSRQSNPDTGTKIQVSATGMIAPAGQTRINGSFDIPGFIRNGTVQGSLTLQGRRGSLTLSITAPASANASSLTHHFTYKIISGTGQFRNGQGSGTVDVTLAPSASQPGQGSLLVGQGKVTLAFHGR